jgi:hypothetical protein
VGKYDATTGVAISPSFITGLNFPVGVAVLGNSLFVTNLLSNTVDEYDATTGAAIKVPFITGSLGFPDFLAVLGNTLFVASPGLNRVGTYDATTGAAINVSFITGLFNNNGVTGLAVLGNTLFVANAYANTVGTYDATTGAAINASFITGLSHPDGLAVLGNTLFVVNNSGNTVGEYDATTGAAINASFITGLNVPVGLAVLGNTLFVTNSGSGTVGEYDATTGAAINASFITGLIGGQEIATNPLVPFASSFAKLEITAGPPSSFQLNESFTLGMNSNGINPVTENVTLRLGTFSVTIPAGSFQQNPNGRFAFQGTINGVSLQVQIVPLGNNMFTFKAEGEGTGVDLTGFTNPVTVVVTIGIDSGTTTVTAEFH